ncbi:MAG: hypothetical protein SFV17_13450 [Candidatus Obscuribacter sp.]|nr:hypothetical protein [Candidatus Melainabacteria bacterium]MDX1987688.1 hypothetical protein [Candidatus Obscuribacter sp.]
MIIRDTQSTPEPTHRNEVNPQAGDGKDGAAVETCHHLQERLLGFTDPTRNHGINALIDQMLTAEEYDAKCVTLGFPSSQELLEDKKGQ